MYDWWEINQVKNVSKSKIQHPCQMPLEVMKNIISTLPDNAIIFDCFMGSGTTGLACYELGYDFIGTEIDTKYYKIAQERIQNDYLEEDKQIMGQMNIYDFLGGDT